jgi:hypothetical protein
MEVGLTRQWAALQIAWAASPALNLELECTAAGYAIGSRCTRKLMDSLARLSFYSSSLSHWRYIQARI